MGKDWKGVVLRCWREPGALSDSSSLHLLLVCQGAVNSGHDIFFCCDGLE